MMELQLQHRSASARTEGDGGVELLAEPAGSTLAEAIEARTVVERAIVRLAAYRRTEADLRRLSDALALMEAAGDDREAFNQGDFAFHVALSEAAHNGLLAGTLAGLHGPLRQMIELFSDAAFRGGRVDDLVEAHARLADAVSRQDADAAPAIVTEMMNRLREETTARADTVEPVLPLVGEPARTNEGERP